MCQTTKFLSKTHFMQIKILQICFCFCSNFQALKFNLCSQNHDPCVIELKHCFTNKAMVRYIFTKVGLISESFSCWLQSPTKCSKNYSDLYPRRIVCGIFLGDLSQSKKLSEIKPPLKFIYSEKATKFCEISTVDLSYVVPVKSKVEISQNFVAPCPPAFHNA